LPEIEFSDLKKLMVVIEQAVKSTGLHHFSQVVFLGIS
jgi:hypothetical protein